jgi:hypothetical protein
MLGNFLLAVIALLTGWAALFPLRRQLGAWGYHGVAFLVGLLAWTFVTTLTTLVSDGYSAVYVVAGHLVFIGAVSGAGWLLARSGVPTPADSAVAWWTWPAAAAVVLGLAAAHVLIGVTVVAFDSYAHYDISGIWLLDTGRIDLTIISGRNVLVPSLHAATRFLGGEWTYAVYPLLADSALALLFGALYAQAFAKRRRAVRIGLSALLVGVLATVPGWVFHSYFVHSNMISAAYLTLAVVGIGCASGFGSGARSADSPAWMVPAGLGAAGFVLARPDGIAYLFVLLALTAILYLARLVPLRAYAVFFGFAMAPIVAVLAAALVELGVWEAFKLDGTTALAVVAAAFVFAGASPLVRRVGWLDTWLSSGMNATRLAVLANVVPITLLLYWKRDTFFPQLSNMLGNLMQKGEWGFLWYTIAGVIAISLVFWRVTARAPWSWTLLYAVGQFLVVAIVVHSTAHGAYLSWNDSFNRVALHVLPLLFWYMGSFVGALADSYTEGDR